MEVSKMTEKINLKELEKKAWETQFIDGTADIIIGILIGITTIMRFNMDVSLYQYLWFLPLVLFVGLVKKYITNPRIGIVKFSKERIRKDRMYVLIVSIIIAILFAIAFTFPIGDWYFTMSKTKIIVAAILFTIWSSIAYFRDFPRLYLYAFLMTLSFILTDTNSLKEGIPIGAYAWSITAIIMVAIGIVYLAKFIKKYPLPSMEVTT
jgi:hypothetical protein